MRVFEKTTNLVGELHVKKAAEAIYRNVRCGAIHTGFATHKVGFQRINQNAFLLTYRHLPDGQLDTESPVQSILVNSQRIHDAVESHLERYLEVLRQPQKSRLKDNFNRLMRSDWGIGGGGNVVGMTEEEFVNAPMR